MGDKAITIIENTAAIQKRLKKESMRTKIDSEEFFNNAPNIPKHFTLATLEQLISGDTKEIRQADLDFILTFFSKIRYGKKFITKTMWQRLDKEIERTNIISIGKILDHPDKPHDLSGQKAKYLLKKELFMFPQTHWDFILKRYASFPAIETQVITKKERELFISEIDRTKISYLKLSRCFKAKGKPKNPTSFFLDIVNGKTQCITAEQWQEIMYFLKRRPSKAHVKRSIKSKIAITEALRFEIKNELERTGKTLVAILKMRPAHLDTLNSTKIGRWVSGQIKKATKEEWDFVIEALKSTPDSKKPTKNPSPTKKSVYHYQRIDHLPISDEIREELQSLIEATGMGPIIFYQRAENPPQTLNGYMINSWVKGKTKSATQENLRWAIEEYRKLAKKQKKTLKDILKRK